MTDKILDFQYRPELLDNIYYNVAKYCISTGERIPFSGEKTSFVYRSDALVYANDINKANGYPEAR